MMEMSMLIFMGAIAVAVVVMAMVQVAVLLYSTRVARRVDRLLDRVEKEIQPMLGSINVASGDMSRVTSLVVAQLERADQLFARFAGRFEHLMSVSQDAVVEPVKRSAAVLHGLHVALTALREAAPDEPPRDRTRSKDEDQDQDRDKDQDQDQDALFIG